MDDFFGLPLTLILIALFTGTFVYLVKLERKPVEFGKVRLIPPTFLLILCGVALLVALARLIAELGPHHPFR